MIGFCRSKQMAIRTYFLVENSQETKRKILEGIRSPSNLYGSVKLEQEGKVKIIEPGIKRIFKLPLNSIVVTNRIKYLPLLRLTGKKVILISINSNHDLSQDKKSIKGFLMGIYYGLLYRLCNSIVCMSDIQRQKLNLKGIKNAIVIPLGVDEEIVNRIPSRSKDYYLSIGNDKGRDFDFVRKVLKKYKHRVVVGSDLSYEEYLKVIGNCKALVLKIDTSREGSSDLSGTTTIYEALLMKKPIFINKQPWLEELFKENYHTYEDEDGLKKLLESDVGFKEFEDKSHLTLRNFVERLMKHINEFFL